MVELLIGVGALVVGFALGWFRSGPTRIALAAAEARLASSEQRVQELQIFLTAARTDLEQISAAFQEASSARASAEAVAARVPPLEQELQQVRQVAADRHAEITQLRARGEEQAKAAEDKLRLLNE